MKNFLVTGSSGFIGKKLIKILEGNIKILSRNFNKNYDTIICDFEKDIIPNNSLENIDTVFHLAGLAHDTNHLEKLKENYYKVNVDSTIQLAKLAVKSNVKKFVFVSSVKAGGSSSSGVCTNEDSQGNPEGVYGKTKREAELELLKIGQESNMHVSIIRPSLVYGPKLKGNLGLMRSGIKKGWFPPLPETGNKRSMIHVDDLVQAIVLVADDSRADGEIFIATDGIPYSSREIYNHICIMVGKRIPKWYVPKIAFDIVGLLSPNIKYKIKKLLDDECYSSAKLESIGFKANKSLKNIDETDY